MICEYCGKEKTGSLCPDCYPALLQINNFAKTEAGKNYLLHVLQGYKSDYETVKAILDQTGVPYQKNTSEEIKYLAEVVPGTAYALDIQNSEGVGYRGFLATWYFGADGTLLKIGHYED